MRMLRREVGSVGKVTADQLAELRALYQEANESDHLGALIRMADTIPALVDEIERLRRERDGGAVYTDFDRQIHVRVGRSESDDATQVYVTYLGWINEITIPDGGSHDDVTAQTVAWPHGVKRSVAIVNETQAAEIEATLDGEGGGGDE